MTLATACMSAKPKQPTDQKAMDAIAQQIQTTIGQQATVTQARVVY
ncbi:hypothetical protein HC031_09500 [Planosporangium thailandense]|uniref:Uncharacterized protein n=1 Tax=Planosporangium thailandense TaxID=765197 RepID=A0ABX0XV93_9ACTN|nr:hypothetical protein [Planosporangium thailandense]NJC69947.1 hypothetical protein [Planosporangium thailandense]